MKPSTKGFPVSTLRLIVLLVIGVAVVLVILGSLRKSLSKAGVLPVVLKQAVAMPTNPLAQRAKPQAVQSTAGSATEFTNWANFQKHPFPPALQGSNYQWTMADGTDTNVILHLAHNSLEYQRMVTENRTIYRRQLVYFSQGFDALAQQTLQNGGVLHQIALPGLDGQVFSVDVKNTDLRDGGNRGQIYGQLPGQPDSMVTVAFFNNREAFTIISPHDQIYLQAEAHEPGEIVVKSINPQIYGQPQY